MRISSNSLHSDITLKKWSDYLIRPFLGVLKVSTILLALVVFNVAVTRADDDSIGSLLKSLQNFFQSSSSASGPNSCHGQTKYCEDNEFCQSECGNAYMCSAARRCVGALSASCRTDFDCNTETDEDADGNKNSMSGLVCNTALKFCTMRSNSSPCGRDEECLEGYSCSFGVCSSGNPQGEGSTCKLNEDCSAPAICDLFSKKCLTLKCESKKDCPGEKYQCVDGKCIGCRLQTESCSDSNSSLGCCGYNQLECRQNVCRKKDLGKKIGDSCSSAGASNPFITSSECGGTLECENSICKGGYNTKCLGNEDCITSLGCVRNECKNCKRQADGRCLLGLGAYCDADAECESNKCDDYDKVCVKDVDLSCKEDSDCDDDKLKSPNTEEIKPICKDEMCQLCVLAGNEVRSDFQCCGEANPHNGVCLIDGGGSCKNKEQCKSKKCEEGKCVGSADGTGQKVAFCGDRCCNGSETANSCPEDCPQRSPIADECVPNLPTSSLDHGVCLDLCSKALRCNGYAVYFGEKELLNCRCDSHCPLGRICYDTSCLSKQSACEKLCINSIGKVSYTDGLGVVECSCGGVSSSSEITAIPVSAATCKSQRACRLANTSVCKSGFSCCDSFYHAYKKGEGPCVDQEVIVQLEEGQVQ